MIRDARNILVKCVIRDFEFFGLRTTLCKLLTLRNVALGIVDLVVDQIQSVLCHISLARSESAIKHE